MYNQTVHKINRLIPCRLRPVVATHFFCQLFLKNLGSSYSLNKGLHFVLLFKL